MFFIFWTSHGITHTPIPDLVQLSAQFSPEQQLLCFPKQRVARGKESVSNPSPNNTPRSGEAGEISCKLRLNKAALLDCRDLSEHVVGIGTDQPDRPYHGPGIASLQMPQNTRHRNPLINKNCIG